MDNTTRSTRLAKQKAVVAETDPGIVSEKKFDRRLFLKMTGMAIGTAAVSGMLGKIVSPADAAYGGTVTGTLLDPLTIPKYVTQLIVPPVYAIDDEIKIDAACAIQQILPLKNADGKSTGFGPTIVYAYGGEVKDPKTGRTGSFRFSPGPTFDTLKGVPTKVEWVNAITGPHFLPVDPTLCLANPNEMAMPAKPFKAFPSGYLNAQFPVPMITHVHGLEVSSLYDGHPDQWFTYNGKHGPAFETRHFIYPNDQQPASLWYHDHVQGMTRLNVYAGLAGFYLIRDPEDRVAPLLPGGKYEVPIVIQDRMFFARDKYGHNDLAFPYVGDAADVHPYWAPEFYGDAIIVNGQTWPNLDVDRGQYYFRILNGSNARFYNLFFDNGMSFIQVGSDGGYLQSPVRSSSILLAPGERVDILLDFSNVMPGVKIILCNNANAPYPDGDPADPDTTGQIMQFTVGSSMGTAPKSLPAILNPTLYSNEWPTLPQSRVRKFHTLIEETDVAAMAPTGVYLDGQTWDGIVSEKPENGTTEDWYIISLTDDAHPIHLHLVQFQIVSRQNLDVTKYRKEWLALNKNGLTDGKLPFKTTWTTKSLPVEPYLQGDAVLPDANEMGWKDTANAFPGQVTRVRFRLKKQDGTPYGFDPGDGPGYVWHCQIVDREDNKMMRPMIVTK